MGVFLFLHWSSLSPRESKLGNVWHDGSVLPQLFLNLEKDLLLDLSSPLLQFPLPSEGQCQCQRRELEPSLEASQVHCNWRWPG